MGPGSPETAHCKLQSVTAQALWPKGLFLGLVTASPSPNCEGQIQGWRWMGEGGPPQSRSMSASLEAREEVPG